MNNVTRLDISETEDKIHIHLTPEQREKILREYHRIVMDRGDDWETLIKELIIKESNTQ